MKIDTRPASSEDVDWLADLFTQSMREASLLRVAFGMLCAKTLSAARSFRSRTRG
jgi:hypothetical protein